MNKKLMLVLFVGLFVMAACHSSHKAADKTHKKSAKAEAVKAAKERLAQYEEAIEHSLACKVDSDCVAIPAGCCQCDGQAPVNKTFTKHLEMLRGQACHAAVACTMQMCHTEIDVTCKAGKCHGVVKPEGKRI